MEFPGSHSYTIIGKGALGGALLHFLKSRQMAVQSTWSSYAGSVFHKSGPKYVEKIVESSAPQQESQTGNVVFITVPDDTIKKVAGQLAKTSINWKGKSVIHCSGNLFSDELCELEERGARTASMHPLQTFKRGDNEKRFANIYVSLQGDSRLCEFLSGMVKEMKAMPLNVQKEQKQALHIAAVFASNYFVTILYEAEKLLNEYDISQGLEVLKPLVKQTFKNVEELGSLKALTGPVARGDSISIQKHLMALQKSSSGRDLYKLLGSRALQLAKKGNKLTAEDIIKIEELFE